MYVHLSHMHSSVITVIRHEKFHIVFYLKLISIVHPVSILIKHWFGDVYFMSILCLHSLIQVYMQLLLNILNFIYSAFKSKIEVPW
jgi:hypothetical protein